MGSLMGNITQPCLGRLSPSWIFLFHSWEISALKMPDSSALCLVLCVESNLLLFGCYVLSSSLQPYGLQHASSSVLHYLLEFSPIHVHQSVMLSNHFILCQPLLLLPSIFPRIRVFSNELALWIRQSNYWDFSISPSKEYSGLISFRIDWFDLAVQGTLKSLLQYYDSKATTLWHSAFFMAQLSHLYITTGTTIALTVRTFVGKVMSFFYLREEKAVLCELREREVMLLTDQIACIFEMCQGNKGILRDAVVVWPLNSEDLLPKPQQRWVSTGVTSDSGLQWPSVVYWTKFFRCWRDINSK